MPTADLLPILASLRDQGLPVASWAAMTGDVSQRRYFRLTLEGSVGTAVLALYPRTMRAASRRYQVATALLAGADLRVPALLAGGADGAWLLTEDLGAATVFDLREQSFVALEPYFRAAVSATECIASLDRSLVVGLNPPLDTALLRRELAMTQRVFFEPHGLVVEPRIEAALDALCTVLGAGPLVPCHRDFGVRNLLPLGPDGQIGIVDHQDLRLGPVGYDLASLLNDSLFPPLAAEERLLQASGCSDRESYHRAAAQRTLKAVGSYAAFADRSPRYLPLIAPTLGRALRHLQHTPETASVAATLADRWQGLVGENPVD